MESGFGASLIFLIMFGASLVALVVAVPVVAATWLMPFRWAYARWIGGRDRLDTFRQKHRSNPATRFRYLLGMLSLSAPVASAVILCVLAFFGGVASAIWPNLLPDQTAYVLGEAFAVLLFAWFALSLMAIPLSYVYEFYVVHPVRRVRSWSFLIIFLFNLAIPIFSWFAFLVMQDTKAIDYVERRLTGAAPPAVVPIREEAPCSAMLSRMGLRLSSHDQKDPDEGYAPLWFDRYLRGITLDVFDPFECTFTDVKSNPANMTMSLLMTVYRMMVSVFSLSVYALLVQRIFETLRRRARPGTGQTAV